MLRNIDLGITYSTFPRVLLAPSQARPAMRCGGAVIVMQFPSTEHRILAVKYVVKHYD